VAEACSGLRYLIASLTVGALFAYLNYQRAWKRVVFVGLSVAVPILANFVRAYMIVMIGHLSDMKLAVGVDHFLYGWVFFGVVIGLLFWLGSFWCDPAPKGEHDAARVVPGRPASSLAAVAAGVGVLTTVAVWPVYAAHLDTLGSGRGPVLLSSPQAASGWRADPTATLSWSPRYSGAAATSFAVYRKEARTVALYVGYYRNQRPGAELVSSMNSVDVPPWLSTGAALHREDLGEWVQLRQTHLRAGGRRLLVWEWYRIGGRDLINPYLAKALLARDRLLGRSDDSAVFILASPYEDRPERAAETLREFARDMRPQLLAALDAAGLEKPR
jgi:EpsI family protein